MAASSAEPPASRARPAAGGSRSQARRLQLLDAADRIVQRDGPETSMASIAAEAGITKPILYRHFGDKSGLFQALADRHIAQLLDELRAALLTEGEPRDRVHATIDAYLAAIEERPEVYRFLMHRAAAEDLGVHGQMALFIRRVAGELAAGIAVELQWGPERRAQAEAWAHGIVGMVQVAGDAWLDAREVPRAELTGWLTDLLWGGYPAATGR